MMRGEERFTPGEIRSEFLAGSSGPKGAKGCGDTASSGFFDSVWHEVRAKLRS